MSELNITSNRFSYRPLLVSDIDWYREMVTSADVMRYIGTGDALTEVEAAEKISLVTRRAAGGKIGFWAIIDGETEQTMGMVGLLPLPIEERAINWDLMAYDRMPDAEIEIGYILRKHAWGKGVATEAAERLLRFAFEETELMEIVAVTDAANHASRNVLGKIGLDDLGARRAYAEVCTSFSITRHAWEARQAG